nr:unnamed protein product [Callosobruchus analis]
MTWKQHFHFVLDNITVEPMLACHIIPSFMASLATQNLNLEKACRVNLRYSKEVCDALSERRTESYVVEETNVQQLVASMLVWKTALQSSLPAFLIMFVGSWSDRWRKRKPLMLFPILGDFMTAIGLLVCTYFFEELPMEANGFVEAFFPAMTGGWFILFVGVLSYIADITAETNRTLRIGIVTVFCSLGIPIGQALSGILYQKIGFYGVFSTSAVAYTIGFCYGYLYVKEPKQIDEPMVDYKSCALLRDFFSVSHLADTFRVAFKGGENSKRIKLIMLMVVTIVVCGPMQGEPAVTYLYTRLRFNWDEVDFSIFSTYSMCMDFIGTCITVGLLSHVCKVHDAIIGMCSCASKILACFVYGFAKTVTVFYLGAAVEIFNNTSLIVARSITSKLVPSNELGKANSIFGLCEAVVPLIYGSMYSASYAATISTMPGAFYIIGGCVTILAAVTFGYALCY